MIEGLNRVLVVGGGIGGMATAVAMRQRGVAVDIVDIDPDWKVYGAGITITGPTLRAFQSLGLLGEIERHGFFVSRQRHHLFNGTLLAEVEPQPAGPGLPAAGAIMRPMLHQIMSSEVRRLDVGVQLGVTVDTIDPDSGTVVFNNGTSGHYDLVVAADGIYSRVRSLLFPDAVQPTYSGQMSWRVVAPRPADMVASEFFFGHEVTGGINPCSQQEVYAFILHPEPQPRRIPDAEKVSFLKEKMAPFGGRLGAIRDAMDANSSIVQRPFEYALQPKPWSIGRVVLIGDAAHATTAHLASGAGIAVEDALVLAEELEQAPGNVPSALRSFTERRYERCRLVVESSVAIGQRQLEGAPADEIGMRMAKAMHALAEAI